jgi:GTP-binding protein Era
MNVASEHSEAGGESTRAGYVAIIGYPNAGKSSLMNRLLDQKLSIVTPFAQTTRERVLGIDSRGGVQMVFVDTPGLVDPRYLLHRAMLSAAVDSISEADVLLLLIDAAADIPAFADEVMALVRRHPQRIVVANKIDVAGGAKVDRVREWAREHFGAEPMLVSAETGTGAGELRAAITERLPESPFLFPEDDVSSQSVRFFVSEFIRETVFEQYEKEVPYSIAVKVEEFREAADPIYIRATIYVERASQKAILVGSGGGAIKRLGSVSRHKIEDFVGAPVYLDLWVKVLPRWRKDPLQLQRLGFKLPATEQSS